MFPLSRSDVTYLKSYYLDTQTDTHATDFFTLTTKMIANNTKTLSVVRLTPAAHRPSTEYLVAGYIEGLAIISSASFFQRVRRLFRFSQLFCQNVI